MKALEPASFSDPPVQYRPAPLWVWNDDMNEERIRQQLKELKLHGFGGAFIYPRPGLVTPYLGEEWFALWSAALDEAEQLDLKLYIYDENSYPSGFAGGHVPSELPDCAEKNNMLVIDYCDLQVGSKSYTGINTIYAQTLVYEAQGFEANPWDNAIQFKRRLLDRNTFSEQSGFTAAYRFHIKVAWPKSWKMAPLYVPPAAADNDVLDYGLFDDFIVVVKD
jgi:hypothetical protein